MRLASGRLKQVEELSSEDFLEGAQLLARTPTADHSPAWSSGGASSPAATNWLHEPGRTARLNSLDDNNNNSCSVFNSPEPHASDNSPTPMDFSDAPQTGLSGANRHATNFDHAAADDDDEDELVDVVSPFDAEPLRPQVATSKPSVQVTHLNQPQVQIDLSVVRDFLEVGPPGSAAQATSASASAATNNPSPGLASANQPSPRSANNLTVLIKFFLDSSRSVVFIEVPIEHPFFVFHRGWSSWNPQRTYDKFGLKCRKLKIGDTCISLIRRLPRPQSSSSSSSQQSSPDHIRSTRQVPSAQQAHSLQVPSSGQLLRRQLHGSSILAHQPSHNQQESDCNIMFSSIKINE